MYKLQMMSGLKACSSMDLMRTNQFYTVWNSYITFHFLKDLLVCYFFSSMSVLVEIVTILEMTRILGLQNLRSVIPRWQRSRVPSCVWPSALKNTPFHLWPVLFWELHCLENGTRCISESKVINSFSFIVVWLATLQQIWPHVISKKIG